MQIVGKNINNTGIWLSVNPITSKCPSLSPYVYCANNPIKLVDLDGMQPRIYVELKGFRYVFVTTGAGKNTVVYTYGRYWGTKDKSSLPTRTSPKGEGVLRRLTII